MYDLPTTVEIGGREFTIRENGDYRMILDLFSILEDPELENNERIICALIVFYEDLNDVDDLDIFGNHLEEAVQKMFDFFNAGKPDGKVAQARKLIDWEGDSAMIVSAINNVAKQEIRAEKYIHWWTFMGYYMAIGESTLSTVVSIREKISKGNKLEKWEKKFKAENPQYFSWKSKTVDEIEAENWLMEVWNKE